MFRASRAQHVEPSKSRSAGNFRLPGTGFLKQRWGWVDPSAVNSGFGHRVRARAAAHEGFTLIEVLVSALLVLLISAAVAEALVTSSDFTGYTRNHYQANVVAQQDQERMKSMSDTALTALHQTRTVTLNNTQYTVTSSATFLDATGGSSCTSRGAAYFKLTSTVSWAGAVGGAGKSVTEESLITRSLAGSMVATTDDQTAAPLAGVNINASGQNSGYSASGVTDQNGCVAFAGLPSDSYTLTYTDLGFVDVNGNASPTQTQSVNQTSTSAANAEVMGQAGSVSSTFYTVNSSHAALTASGYELSYYGSGNGNKMTALKTVGSGTAAAATQTATSLFPFWASSTTTYTNNYQLWAGACEQEQPLQPPTGSGTATVAPGAAGVSPSNGTPTVAEPAIDVAVKYNGAYVAPGQVWVTFTGSGTGGACSDKWQNIPVAGTEVVSGVTKYIYPAPFASTAAVGASNASATGDPGNITVCVQYTTGATTRHESTTAMTNTNFTAPTPLPATMDLKNDTTSGTGHTASASGPCT
jgi:Tfp pilus assembly protein PilV